MDSVAQPISPIIMVSGFSSAQLGQYAHDLHTSQAALKFEFNDHVVFDADFDKHLDLNEVKGVYECRMAIQILVDENLRFIKDMIDESQTYGPWVCSTNMNRVLLELISCI